MAQEKQDIESMWDWNDYQLSEEIFTKAIDQADPSQEEYILELKTQLARTYSLRGEYQEAEKILSSLGDVRNTDFVTAKTRYALEYGRVKNSSGDKSLAKRHFESAIDFAKEANNEYLYIDALHMMALITDSGESVEWHNMAIEAVRTTSDEKAQKWEGALLNNLGWLYHDMELYNDALEIFKQALEWREMQENEKATNIARWSVARCMRSLEEYNEALEIQRMLLDEYGQKEDGYVYEEIAENMLALGQNEEAKEYFKTAFEMLSKDEWFVRNESERLKRIEQLGQK